MTATTARAPAAPGSAPPPGPAGAAGTAKQATDGKPTAVAARPSALASLRSAIRAGLQGTPGRLRLLGGLSVVTCVLFGVVGFVGVSSRGHALGNARSDAAQLVRVQTIRTSLVAADANLTNAFLVGGLEPSTQRAAYTKGIDTASRTLAEAAGVNPDDARRLQDVNGVVTTYTGLVEASRANNRQGFPIGAAYLRQASLLLRDKALPPLEQLVRTEEGRVDDSYAASRSAGIVATTALVVCLVVLLVTLGWLALRTRRWINVPLAVATAIVAVVGLAMLATMALSQHRADSARTGPYRTTVSLATARIDAFDAKSAESLTLIARGSGQAFEDRFQVLTANARQIVEGLARDTHSSGNEQGARTFLLDFLFIHSKIATADHDGDHAKAVALATATNKDANSNTFFGNFDDNSGRALAARSAQLRSDLGSARTPLRVLSWLVLLAGLAAAAAAWRGVNLRLREYR